MDDSVDRSVATSLVWLIEHGYGDIEHLPTSIIETQVINSAINTRTCLNQLLEILETENVIPFLVSAILNTDLPVGCIPESVIFHPSVLEAILLRHPISDVPVVSSCNTEQLRGLSSILRRFPEIIERDLSEFQRSCVIENIDHVCQTRLFHLAPQHIWVDIENAKILTKCLPTWDLIPKFVFSDVNFVRFLIVEYGQHVCEWIDKTEGMWFWDDNKTCQLLIKHVCPTEYVLSFVGSNIKKQHWFVTQCVRLNGLLLEFFPEFSSDFIVCSYAGKENPNASRFFDSTILERVELFININSIDIDVVNRFELSPDSIEQHFSAIVDWLMQDKSLIKSRFITRMRDESPLMYIKLISSINESSMSLEVMS